MVEELAKRLRPHQTEPVTHLVQTLRNYQSAVDFSDMGTGKTVVAAAVAKILSLPTLAIVPRVAVTAWHRASAMFEDKISVIGYEKLRAGNTQFGHWEHPYPSDPSVLEYFKCQCCQCKVDMDAYSPCYTHPLGIHCLEHHKKSHNYGRFIFHPGVQFVIFDEVQRCGGLDSLNAEMLIAVKNQRIKMLALSATAACGPLGMRALGYNLDLHNDKHDLLQAMTESEYGALCKRVRPNFFRWAAGYGCRRDPKFHGFKWFAGREQQQEVMGKIRDSILPHRGVRVRTSDIPNFPKRIITAELYDLDEPAIVDRLYAEMANALSELEARAADDVDSEHPLTKILRIRQKLELLKVPLALELARDLIESGHSVGFFVNFSQTIKALAEKMNTRCIIDGSILGVRHRQQSIDNFNSNVERAIIINSAAGGAAVSLPDLTGEYPRVGLVFPGNSAVDFRQLVGRFHRLDSKSTCYYRVLCAANTVETTMHRNLCAKLDNLDKLNDDDLVPESVHLLKHSIASILN